MMRSIGAALVVSAASLLATPGVAGAPAGFALNAQSRGAALVQQHCARCHGVGRGDASPFAPAPPLREIVRRYPPEYLAEAFAEGITVGHPAMPVFEFPPETIGDLLTYLESLSQ